MVEVRAVCKNGDVFSMKNGNMTDLNNVKGIDKSSRDVLFKKIEIKYRGISGQYKEEFQEIFDLIKDRVTYTHYY